MWPKMWSILKNVLCTVEKKVYSSASGWNVLKISIRSIWSNELFKACVSLLIFCFDDLSFGVSKFPTIIVLLSISLFYAYYCLPYVLMCSYVGCINIDSCYVIFLDWSLDHYVVSLRSILSDMKIVTLTFFWFPFVLEYISILSLSVCECV